MNKLKNIAILLALTALVVINIAYAAGGEAEGGNIYLGLLYKVINFSLLVFVLYKFGKAPVLNFLQNGAELAQRSLKDADIKAEEKQKELEEYKSRLTSMKKEIDEMVEEAKHEAQLEKERIIVEADKEAEKILELASFTIDQETKKAKAELRDWLAQETVELSSGIIQKKIKATNHQSLIRDYLNHLN